MQFTRTAGTVTFAELRLAEGGTVLNRKTLPMANNYSGADLTHVISPTAGSHTYKLQALTDGTVTLEAAPTYPAYIIVEDVTGSGVSGHTHTQLDDTGWITPTLENSWVNYDTALYQPARYRRVGSIVYITGLVRSGTNQTNIFTLPVGFRPLRNLHFATAQNGLFGILEIKGTNGSPAGGVHHNTGGNTWFSIECSFMVD